MSGTVRLHVRETNGNRGRRHLLAVPHVEAPAEAPPPAPAKVPRVARLLALAHHWQGILRSGAVRDQADLARLVGVSRARVTQVMRLLDLAPGIQACVLDGGQGPGRGEKALRALAAIPLWTDQRRAWDSGLRGVANP